MRYAFLLFALFIACQPAQPPRTTGVIADKAMVVSAHPVASAIGAQVLKDGGNAFDAAIAVQFALAVVFPRAGNIGGGGFALYRKADGEVGSLDFREKAPIAATHDMFLDEQGNVIPGKSLIGHWAAGVPGTVDGMCEMHAKLGSLPMARLIQPAIDVARKGVVLTNAPAELLNRHREEFLKVNADTIHLVRDAPWKAGDTVYHHDLAETLERIKTDGRDGFYKGKTAELMLEEFKRGNAPMAQADFDRYKSVWRKPLVGTFKNYRVISMPPPSSGGIAVLQLLKGIEAFDVKAWGHNSAKAIHAMTEVERRVYADRATYLGDPDFVDVPQEMLLAEAYIRERMSDISMEKKTPSAAIKEGKVDVIESVETTHFSIVDQFGNAISLTTTVNGYYGCKVMVKGAGFFLNNEMDDFSVKPGVPNQFGLVGAEANAIAPEKRMLSSMTPTILEKDGKLFMVLGSPGGSTIITSVFQAILNVTEHGMTMQEAVNAPRMHHQWLPDRILREEVGPGDEALKGLRALGHEIELRDRAIGKIEAILVLPDGRLEGAPDRNRGEDDTAVGF